MSDRREKPRGSSFPSVYQGLSPAAQQLLRASAESFHAQQVAAREASRHARLVRAARAGLAANPSWGESVLASGAL